MRYNGRILTVPVARGGRRGDEYARPAVSPGTSGASQAEDQLRPIDRQRVQAELDQRLQHDVYLHLETTTGSYTKLGPEKKDPVIAFVRNARVNCSRGTISGSGPFRVGLKLEGGWVYADGLTDFEVNERDELLLAGVNGEGQLTMALQLSLTPFREGPDDAR